MKFKTTSKELKSGTYFLFACGYEELQTIANGIDAIAYHAGQLGWDYDVYKIGRCYITTGYRNTVGKRIPSELLRKYNTIADEIREKYTYSSEYWCAMEMMQSQFATELEELLITD